MMKLFYVYFTRKFRPDNVFAIAETLEGAKREVLRRFEGVVIKRIREITGIK